MSRHRPKRVLRIDWLEPRRLFAGLDVFVFNDLDSSHGFDSDTDSAIEGKAVYVDINGDNRPDANEPIAVTGPDGIAHFTDLVSGGVSVRLLGSNASSVQTTPTVPAPAGNWFGNSNSRKLLNVVDNASAWVANDNSVVRIDLKSGLAIQTIRLGSVVDALVWPTGTVGGVDGLAIVHNSRAQTELVRLNPNDDSSSLLFTDPSLNLTQLVRVGNTTLVRAGSTTEDLYRLVPDFNSSTGYHLSRLGGIGQIHPASITKGLGSNTFAILEPQDTGSRLSIYRLTAGGVELQAERSFPNFVSSYEPSPDGTEIALASNGDYLILDVSTGLPTRATLPDASGPSLFDPIRGLLYTVSRSNPGTLIAWNDLDWTRAYTVSLTPNGNNPNAFATSFAIPSNGQSVIGIGSGSIYRQSLALAAPSIANISDQSTTRIQIGVHIDLGNIAPVLAPIAPVAIDEDTSQSFDADSLRAKASDANGDPLYYLVQSPPAHGHVEWSALTGGRYVPDPDAFGTDSFVIQAYDGSSWSNSQTVSIQVRPVNDAPRGVLASTLSFAENVLPGITLATIRADDPDPQDVYDFTLDDPRFVITAGALSLKPGYNINFEKEPKLVFSITAINRWIATDRISQFLTFGVLDRNDPPSAINVPFNPIVPENTLDVVLGDVSVVDEDAISNYVWSTTDGRFVVVDGKLQLSPGISLDFETQKTIVLTLMANDRLSGDFISKQVTVSVSDQDDPPQGIILSGAGQIPEKRAGRIVGNASVLDPDVGEVYNIAVDDARFEVVRGVVKLKNGVSVLYQEPGYIDLTFTATSQRSGIQIKKVGRVNVIKDQTPYHNDDNPGDVDGDGHITPLDPLIIINYLNKRGSGPPQIPEEGEGDPPDIDVDGDGMITPIDILIVINRLNDGSNNGSGENGGNGGGGNPPEGESSDLFRTLATNPSRNSSASATDLSLASYIADLDTEYGPKRARRS